MKYIFVYVYVFFVKIIDAFKPYITKFVFAYESNYIIKSISGLFKNDKQILETNKQILETNKQILETNNNLPLEKEKIIIPGYMDHEPKTKVSKKWNQSSAVKSTTTEVSIGGPFSGKPFTQPGQL
jgi:hypothetical protein